MQNSLDILLPTYNRAGYLRECLQSVFSAAAPASMEWRVTVLDNNSSDDTRAVAEEFIAQHGERRIRYLFEKKQGKSHALNTGLRETDRTIIGLIDDDEHIDGQWLQVIEKWFANGAVDYIGGPCLGLWRAERPDWIPPHFEGVISADNPEEIPREPIPFGDPRVFFRGGNAVLRKAVFDRIGNYDSKLGRFAEGLGSCEDHDIYNRLMAGKFKGMYVPELVIYHVVPPERLTRKYYRRWAYDHAAALARLERRSRQNVAHVGRVPRYMIGDAVNSLRALAGGSPAERFSAELQWWTLAGYAVGAYRD